MAYWTKSEDGKYYMKALLDAPWEEIDKKFYDSLNFND